MFMVYVDIDKDGEVCKPYSGREYFKKEDAYEELKEAEDDIEFYCAYIEEV